MSGAALLAGILAGGGMALQTSELSGEAALDGITAGGGAVGLYIPTWVASATVGTWGVIPFSNTLSALDPKTNAGLNPAYPSSPEWYGGGHANIVTAWCGACYDADTDTLWMPLGGGHTDYGGNEPYKAQIAVETPAWSMVRPPSGAIGNILTTNDGQEATGVYADGQPRAVHSYNKPVYIPGVGPALAVLGATWRAATGPNKFLQIDPDTGLGTLKALNGSPALSSSSGSAYDPSRHVVWYRGEGTAGMYEYDVAADTWTAAGSTVAVSGSVSICYLPDDDCLLVGIGTNLRVFDCATNTWYSPTFSGSGALSNYGLTQWRWCAELGACIGWHNATSTTLITSLTKPTNPRTDTWTIGTLTVDGSNAVTPTAATGAGTFGRFSYSNKLKIAILFNSTSGSHYFFKVA